MTAVACEPKVEELAQLSSYSIPVKPVTVTFKIKNYCPVAGRRFSDLIVINESMKIEKNELRMDWDRDGISNTTDNNSQFNIDFKSPDTNLDGYSDLLMFAAGIYATNQIALYSCSSADRLVDLDFDGLNKCEERLLGTYDDKYDTDGDMLSDKIEIRFGMNPKDPIDAFQDPDSDGYTNYEEVKRNTPIHESETEQVSLYALNYETFESQNCFDFTISNIPVVGVSNGNSVRINLIEQVLPVGGTSAHFAMRDYVKTVPRTVMDKTVFVMDYSTLVEAQGK